MSRRPKAETVALADQVLAMLDEFGPLTTAEIAGRLPPWQFHSVRSGCAFGDDGVHRCTACGHFERCENEDHWRAVRRMSTSVHPMLTSMSRRSQLGRTPLDSNKPTLWWRL